MAGPEEVKYKKREMQPGKMMAGGAPYRKRGMEAGGLGAAPGSGSQKHYAPRGVQPGSLGGGKEFKFDDSPYRKKEYGAPE